MIFIINVSKVFMISGAISKVGQFFSSRVGIAVGIGAMALSIYIIAYRFFSGSESGKAVSPPRPKEGSDVLVTLREQEKIADVTVRFSDGKTVTFHIDYTSSWERLDRVGHNPVLTQEHLPQTIQDVVSRAITQGTLTSASDIRQTLLEFMVPEKPAAPAVSAQVGFKQHTMQRIYLMPNNIACVTVVFPESNNKVMNFQLPRGDIQWEVITETVLDALEYGLLDKSTDMSRPIDYIKLHQDIQINKEQNLYQISKHPTKLAIWFKVPDAQKHLTTYGFDLGRCALNYSQARLATLICTFSTIIGSFIEKGDVFTADNKNTLIDYEELIEPLRKSRYTHQLNQSVQAARVSPPVSDEDTELSSVGADQTGDDQKSRRSRP